jgi:hypothetical protein
VRKHFALRQRSSILQRIPGRTGFLCERLMNASIVDQVAVRSLKTILVVTEHLGAASGKLCAARQDERPSQPDFAWHCRQPSLRLRSWHRTLGAREPAHSGREEATMDLRMRLNVLAAIISLAFLTAIVVGMI